MGQEGPFTASKHRRNGKMSLVEIGRNVPAEGFPSTPSFSCAAEEEMAAGEKTKKGSVRGGRQNLSVA